MRTKSRKLQSRRIQMDWTRFRSIKPDPKGAATSGHKKPSEKMVQNLDFFCQQLRNIERKVEHLGDLVAASLTNSVPMPTNTTLSVKEFCARNHISRRHFFNLKETGKGPRYTKPGKEIRISLEAEDEWRTAMEIAPARPNKLISPDALQ